MFRRISGIAASALLLGFVACSDDNPSGGFDVPAYGDSSSSVEPAPKSSDDVGGSAANVASSSSQNVAESSSSVIANSSSSAKTPKNTTACLWNASKGDYLVNTGFDPDSTRGAGLWYNISDDPDGGVTEVYSPDVCGFEAPEYECAEALVEYCGSYCAEYRFRKGTSAEIFGGMGFNVAGIEDPHASHALRYGDISDWGGVCVTYAADRDVLLRLYTDDTFYQAEFGKSTEFVEKCVTWDALNAAEASKHVSSIRFIMPGTDGTKEHLSIAAVGKYDANGACDVDGYAYVLPKSSVDEGIIVLRSSSSKQSSFEQSSSSGITGPCTTPESVSDLWYGPRNARNGNDFVNTGLDNGSETSGYWFSFSDEKGDAFVSWPVMQYEYENVMNLLIEVCEGICGTFKYRSEGVVGIGFNVAGEALSGKNGAPDIADVSAWGGLCVTYTSESDMDVVMSNDTAFTYIEKIALLPKVTLPKSVEVKTVCSKWSDFVSYAETPSDPTHVASILFVVYGNAGSESKFNVIGIGKYADVQNICK
ncbi:hypothetical protein [Fibrobacter sp. UWB12]|uniref:hypothetical protein n=1 Tax=Fibrobacter sp. UWB12 TaxID=1896203 RepID=UPI00090EBE1A|nr:hypothetical protein [Fibrobacter sp. UWB12]SHK42256.1 hypothetical protein SAMN05720759_102409 [Fibrobacter sp. UWB12]